MVVNFIRVRREISSFICLLRSEYNDDTYRPQNLAFVVYDLAYRYIISQLQHVYAQRWKWPYFRYTNIETCLTPLPEVSDNQEIAGGKLAKWPQRLNSIPPRISRGTVEGVTDEIFQQDSQLWKRRVSYYRTVNNQLGQAGRYRNLLDMNAYLGGFAAALVKDPVWVMNVVPAEAKINTLGAIYERGLIGTYQNW